jgi:penicillin-binding protein 1A
MMSQPPKQSWKIRLPTPGFFITSVAFVTAAAAAAVIFWQVHRYSEYLNQKQEWSRLRALVQATEVFDRHGTKVGEFAEESRYLVSLESLPRHSWQAILAAEDDGFFGHSGVSLVGMMRAFFANIASGRFSQGASTITQQLVRNTFLSSKKTLQRKIDEVLIAREMERRLDKKRILELYLNTVFFGNHSYGIEAASRNYFRKSSTDLTVAESALLAAVIVSPSRLALHKFRDKAERRQFAILNRMQSLRQIDAAQLSAAIAERVVIAPRAVPKSDLAPFLMRALRQELDQRVALSATQSEGFQVDTSIDLRIQAVLRDRIKASLVKHFAPSLLRKQTQVAALVSQTRTGEILAWQGGYDFDSSQFDHSRSIQRPMGSLFLPFFVGLGLDRGLHLLSSVYTNGGALLPSLSPAHHDDLNIFDVLKYAKAEDSARLLSWIGIGTVVEASERLGFVFHKDDLSLALGTGTSDLKKVVRAFSAFANMGRPQDLRFIRQVKRSDGSVVYRSQSSEIADQVYTPEAAFLVRETLRQYPLMGTKQTQLTQNLSFAVGTDRRLHDAWFVGFDEDMTFAIWVGSEFGKHRLAKDERQLRARIEAVWFDLYRQFPSRKHSLPQIPDGISFMHVSDGTRAVTIPAKTGVAVSIQKKL